MLHVFRVIMSRFRLFVRLLVCWSGTVITWLLPCCCIDAHGAQYSVVIVITRTAVLDLSGNWPCSQVSRSRDRGWMPLSTGELYLHHPHYSPR